MDKLKNRRETPERTWEKSNLVLEGERNQGSHWIICWRKLQKRGIRTSSYINGKSI